MNVIIKKVKKQPYLAFAFIAIILAFAAISEQLQGMLKPNTPKFSWQVATGTLLLSTMFYFPRTWLKPPAFSWSALAQFT